ncbi:MAG: signal peptidase II [Planctomycetota bacterium]
MRRPLWFFILVFAGSTLDLISKTLVFRALAPREIVPIIPGVIHITCAENRGVAFSFLADYPAIIFFISVIVLAAIIWIYVRYWRSLAAPTLTAMVLILVGAIGNLVDRVSLGYVRDFIDFVPELPVIGHWAIFNVADICITSGVLLYLITGARKKHEG